MLVGVVLRFAWRRALCRLTRWTLCCAVLFTLCLRLYLVCNLCHGDFLTAITLQQYKVKDATAKSRRRYFRERLLEFLMPGCFDHRTAKTSSRHNHEQPDGSERHLYLSLSSPLFWPGYHGLLLTHVLNRSPLIHLCPPPAATAGWLQNKLLG